MHECKLCKSDEMQNLLIDRNKIFFCKSCYEEITQEDIHPSILKKFRIMKGGKEK